MKKILTLCILSFTLCLIQAASPPDVPPAGAPVAAAKNTKSNETLKTEVIIVTTESPSSDNKSVNLAPVAKVDPNLADTKQQDLKQADTKQQDIKQADTKQAAKQIDNKSTDITKDEKVPKPAVEPTAKSTGNETESAGKEALTPQAVTAKPTVAPNNITEKPTEAPKDVTEKPIHAARGFDGGSFIGGIILTLGLLAIGFMGFKYYKNQTERNYHTL